MVEQLSPKPLEMVNEALHNFDDKLHILKTNVIDDKLEQLDMDDNLYKIVHKVNTLLHTNLFGLWTTWSLLWISLSDLKTKETKSPLLRFVFKKFWGIEWLHRKYIDKTLNYVFADQPQKQDIITHYYSTYMETKNDHTCSDPLWDNDCLNIVANLWLQPDTDKEILKKLPQTSFSYLSQTFFDTLSSQKSFLDPNILAAYGYSVPKKIWPHGIEVIDTQSTDWHPETIDLVFVQTYLKNKISTFVNNKDFIQHIPSDDHIVLALFGGMFVGGDVFAESLLLGIKKPEQFLPMVVPSKSPSWWENIPSSTINTMDMQESSITEELQKYSGTPLTAQMIISSARSYTVPISYIMAIMKNDSGYGTQWLGAKTHNPGNVGNMDDGSTKDRWTWEAGVDAVAQNLQKRIHAYHQKYWSTFMPTLAELTSGKHKDTQERFYNVYMTAPKWPSIVQNYQQDLYDTPLAA